MAQILIVEDDRKTADALSRGLSGEGYVVACASRADEALDAFRATHADLIVLDWMLPDRSGVAIIRDLRRLRHDVRVMLLTARDAVEDRVLGLDSGADDYLVKPFEFAELLARARALLRRPALSVESPLRVADLSVDFGARRVLRGSSEIALTPREFDVLACLARHAGHVVTRRMLAREVWNDPTRVTPIDNLIDVHVTHVRRKVDEGYELKLIRTVRGIGFILGEAGSP